MVSRNDLGRQEEVLQTRQWSEAAEPTEGMGMWKLSQRGHSLVSGR